ncbi:MAG: hypothetical protein ABFS14_08900 [Gemmatimonadota bacterium]
MASKKDHNQVVPGAIQALLDQRTTFQDWLAKLDGVVSDFRPEVAERVRMDYKKRLGDVEAELGTHSSELEDAVAARVARLEELASEHDSRSADLEESQLRHEVGEYTQSDWDEKRAEHEGALDLLSDQIGAERVAVTELEAVLTEVTGQPAASTVLHILPNAGSDRFGDETFGEGPAETSGGSEEEIDANGEDVTGAAEDLDASSEDLTGAPDDAEPESELAPEIVPAAAGLDADSAGSEGEDDAFLDELEFLESLSMDDSQNFDAVSQLLEEEEAGTEKGKKDA